MMRQFVRPSIARLYQRTLYTSALRQGAITSHPVSDPAERPAMIESVDRDNVYPTIGKRKIVGFGKNGYTEYEDVSGYPCPSIEFREVTSEVAALREKEKGDWNNLSIDEKKALYRSSFCQTYAEFTAPDGEWKPTLAIFLWAMVASGLMMIWLKQYVYLPVRTRTKEWQTEGIKKQVYEHSLPIHGISSKYDYENKQWK